MTGEVRVAVETMGGAAKQVQEVAQGFADAVASFRAQVDGLADAFGTDDLGSMMSGIYGAISQAAFDCFEDNAECLAEIGENLQESAEIYAATESAVVEAFQKLHQGMG